MAWVRSSHCGAGDCIEIASDCESNACVEVDYDKNMVLMRDSKDPDGPVLRFTRNGWQQFIQSLKD
jgi:hypothetical protein